MTLQRRVALVDLPGAHPADWFDRLAPELAATPGVMQSSLGRNRFGSYNAGAAVWEGVVEVGAPNPSATFASLRTFALECLDASAPEPFPAGCVKRMLLVAVDADRHADRHADFLHDLVAAPRYIDTIVNWSLSGVRGAGSWTHAWEQEFATTEGFTRTYMFHPYHPLYLDRWFDGEMPERIVFAPAANAYYDSPGSVLRPALEVT